MNRATRYVTDGWRSSFPHRCMGCSSRKARFTFRGRFYADHDHTLCPRCFGSLVNSIRRHR